MGEPAVSVRGLVKTWPGGVVALRSVDLAVAGGEAVTLLGANGSGKSTLLGVLAGLVRPSSGTARLFGTSVDDPESRRRLGYTPENPALPPRATPYDLLVRAARLSGRSDAPDRARDALERLDLAADAGRALGLLSQGTRERVALALALVHAPDLIVLDEPLTGLDVGGRARVVDVLAAEKARGASILVATHWPDALAALTDRAVVLRDGVVETA